MMDIRPDYVDSGSFNGSHRKFAQALAEYYNSCGKLVIIPELDDLLERSYEKISRSSSYFAYAAHFLILRDYEEDGETEMTSELFREAEDVLKDAHVHNVTKSNGVHFIKDKGVLREGSYTKVYGCIRTGYVLDFARSLNDPMIEESSFQGKFYTGADYPYDHNKLCMYIDHEELAAVLGFLDSQKQGFHKINCNHPAGMHVFPGVSAVIADEKRSFDTAIKDIFCKTFHDDKSPEAVDIIKEKLMLDPSVKEHFTFLEKYGGRSL